MVLIYIYSEIKCMPSMAEIQSDRAQARARARLLTLSTKSHSHAHVSKQHSALLTPVSSVLLCYVLYCSVEAAAIATQRSAFSTILAGSILGSQCVSFYEF